ncbi:MAG: STAS domain-containing protein [Negativicutes bacterium]|nr:STAS domain-containing protein [Negativicutes bacterium]
MGDTITVVDNCVIVNLKGRLYSENVSGLQQKLNDYLEQEYGTFIFDMTELEYIGSGGLGVLIATNKRVLPLGGSVTLVGLQGIVKELFEITRLDTIFTMRSSLEDWQLGQRN